MIDTDVKDVKDVKQVAIYLQQAQKLGKQYATLYVKQQESVIGADMATSLLDRAKNLIDRALTWAKDLFTSKVDALGDDVSEDDVLSALDDTSLLVAETLGLTEIQDVIETTVMSELQASGIGQVEAVNEPDACPLCVTNADVGPINIGDTFPSGDTSAPFHFKCRCHVVPANS